MSYPSMVELVRTYYPETIFDPRPQPPLPEFNPQCVCGHDEFAHFNDARTPSVSKCRECRAPNQSCSGFSARQTQV